MTREHNWADNHTFTAARIHRPGSIDEARRIVAAAPRIRAVGTRHSFNGIADSPGEMIDMRGIAADFVLDRAARTVTAGGATQYGALAGWLESQGMALHNMGSLPHISIAGATATGTHGSGDRNGNLSSAVCGLELIGPGGDLVTVRRGEPGFDGMVVGLGAFGVVTRVTLDVQPSFQVRQDAFVDLPWDSLFGNLDAVTSAAYSVSLMTMWSTPTVGRMWLKTRLADGLPAIVSAAHLGAQDGPPRVVSATADDPSERLTPFGGVPGPWSARLPHFRFDREPSNGIEIQSEYMVPRANAVAALRAVRAMGARIDPHLRTSELRSMAADPLWLSPSYGQDSLALHFTWKKEPEPVDALTREIEAALIPLGGRPHWGKKLHAPAAVLAPLYPRMADFRALADARDAAGKFRNDYLARHVFGA